MFLQSIFPLIVLIGTASASPHKNYCKDKDANNQITCDGFEMFPEDKFNKQQPDQYQIKCTNSKEPQIVLNERLFYFLLFNFTITDCNIKTIEKDAFAESALTTISLTNNKIEEVNDHAFRGIKGFSWLYLQENQIKKIGANTFGNLGDFIEEIHLQHNAIERVEDGAFRHLKTLLELNLNNNKLQKITQNTFSGLQNVENLHLNRNEIERLSVDSFNKLKNLKNLYLEGNKITKIKGKTFVNNKKLEFLNLKANKISQVDEDAFKGLSSAKFIILNENPMTTYPQKTFFNVSTSAVCVVLVSNPNPKAGAITCGKQR